MAKPDYEKIEEKTPGQRDESVLVRMLRKTLATTREPIKISHFKKGAKGTWHHPDDSNPRTWRNPDAQYDFNYFPNEKCAYVYLTEVSDRLFGMKERKERKYTLKQIPDVLSDLVEKGFDRESFIFNIMYESTRVSLGRGKSK